MTHRVFLSLRFRKFRIACTELPSGCHPPVETVPAGFASVLALAGWWIHDTVSIQMLLVIGSVDFPLARTHGGYLDAKIDQSSLSWRFVFLHVRWSTEKVHFDVYEYGLTA